jgi:hypothetical protein
MPHRILVEYSGKILATLGIMVASMWQSLGYFLASGPSTGGDIGEATRIPLVWYVGSIIFIGGGIWAVAMSWARVDRRLSNLEQGDKYRQRDHEMLKRLDADLRNIQQNCALHNTLKKDQDEREMFDRFEKKMTQRIDVLHHQ